MTPETISQLWPVFTAGIVFIIWLVRLEARNLYQAQRLNALELKVDSDNKTNDSKFDKLSNKLNDISISLARIEGALAKHERE